MAINFDKAILDMNDSEWEAISVRGKEPEKVTLRLVCVEALTEADDVAGPELLDRFDLAMKIKKENNIELEAAQITKILNLIVKKFKSPLIYGRAARMLDPNIKKHV